MNLRLAGCCLALGLASVASLAAQNESWRKTEASMRGAVRGIIPMSNGTIIAVSAGGDIIRSTDAGTTWQPAGPPFAIGEILSVTADSSGGIVVGTRDQGMLRSVDRGLTWRFMNGLPANPPITALASSPSGMLLAGTPQGVYAQQTDDSWTLTAMRDTIKSISTGNDVGQIYVTTPSNGAFRSRENDAPWKPLTEPTKEIHAIIVDRTLDRIFAVGKGVHSAITWSTQWRTTPVEGITLTSVEITRTGRIYAAGMAGVIRSTDTGNTWSPFNDGLEELAITSLGAGTGGPVYAGTSSGRIYKITMPSGAPDPVTAESSALLPGIPNPTDGATLLPFRLARPERIVMSVHDMLGRTVAIVASGEFGAGPHQLRWDAAGVPQGTYYCRLQGAGWSQTRPLTIRR